MNNNIEFYAADDLGAIFTDKSTTFRLWAPYSSKVVLNLFDAGDNCEAYKSIPMEKNVCGTWFIKLDGNLKNKYYTYSVENNGVVKETQDPYAKACGVNGIRSMVVNLEETDPEGFSQDKGPSVKSLTDVIVTEISVADTTADSSCNAKLAGKFLGLTERGLKNASGKSTGLDHIIDLGVTHVQIMPMYDFGSIDEASDRPQYNWGYDPVNYNVPEGSFSMDPFSGQVRIKECKEMIKAFHDAGIGVIMDVVYNHTFNIDDSCFQKTAPDYFYRKDGDIYSDASACGNEVASDRPMVRKYIVDSLCYLAREYHLDGFRFDLMGVLDIETMNIAYEALCKIKPDIILYGEGWTGGGSTLPESERAMKNNVSYMPGVGVFSDDIRDSIKGHVFDLKVPGFVNGGVGFEDRIKNCVCGSVSTKPGDVVNYVSCHDNLTLWDKLNITCPNSNEDELLAMNRLAASIIFTSQGIPFFLQGEEFARSKPYNGELAENSYNLPIEVNSLKYQNLDRYESLVDYYKGLIAFRRAHKALRLESSDNPKEHIRFVNVDASNVVAFEIEAYGEKLFVAYNANKKPACVNLSGGSWDVYIDNNISGNNVIKTIKDQAELSELSCLVAVLTDN